MKLSSLSQHAEVTARFPSLARAAGIVASPLLRNMGTIGGNVHLDTRCRYVNQTEFWRGAIGGCLKSGGTVCHVVPGGKSCVAAMSSDCVPVLTTLEARVALLGPAGEREVPIAEYYDTDGVSHVKKDPQELCTEIRVPLPAGPWRTGYRKWTVRGSIDFPLVSIALRFDLESSSTRARIRRAMVCLGVLAARPKLLKSGRAGRKAAGRSGRAAAARRDVREAGQAARQRAVRGGLPAQGAAGARAAGAGRDPGGWLGDGRQVDLEELEVGGWIGQRVIEARRHDGGVAGRQAMPALAVEGDRAGEDEQEAELAAVAQERGGGPVVRPRDVRARDAAGGGGDAQVARREAGVPQAPRGRRRDVVDEALAVIRRARGAGSAARGRDRRACRARPAS